MGRLSNWLPQWIVLLRKPVGNTSPIPQSEFLTEDYSAMALTKGVHFLSEAVSELIRDPKWLENRGTSDIILGS